MTKISKVLHRLTNRLNDYMGDYEFALVIHRCRNVIAGKNVLFKHMAADGHPILFNHENSSNARSIVINHLRATIAVAFIKEAYEEVTEYLHYILNLGARSGLIKPERISDSVKVSITANDLLATSTHQEVIAMVTKNIYQQLESERSTIGLIEKIAKRLDLSIEQDKIDTALKYLEMRHIFIHEDGKPNKKFKEKYPDVKLNQKGRINLTETNLHTVMGEILDLIKSLDSEMVTKNLIPASELQP